MGSTQMSFEITKRVISQTVSDQDQRVTLKILAQSSKSEVVVKNSFIFDAHDERQLEFFQGVEVVESSGEKRADGDIRAD